MSPWRKLFIYYPGTLQWSIYNSFQIGYPQISADLGIQMGCRDLPVRYGTRIVDGWTKQLSPSLHALLLQFPKPWFVDSQEILLLTLCSSQFTLSYSFINHWVACYLLFSEKRVNGLIQLFERHHFTNYIAYMYMLTGNFITHLVWSPFHFGLYVYLPMAWVANFLLFSAKIKGK